MSLHRRVVHFATSAILVALIFASCGSGDVVRLPDCIDCRPVELSLDQTLEVELGSDRAVTNDPDAYTWDVTETGTMTLVSEDRGTRPEDEDEFVGGYSRYVVFSFEPTEIGSTQLQFKLVPTDGERPQTSTLDIDVIID